MLVRRFHSASQKQKAEITLPDSENVPPTKIADYTFLIYGRKKAGKTTLCASMDNPYFICTEPGTKALRVRSSNVDCYKQIDSLVKQLETKFASGEKYCSTLIFDTVDLVYEFCFDHVCRSKLISHPNEEKDYGQTWREITVLFRDLVLRVFRLPCGVVFLSHDTEKEVEVTNGVDENDEVILKKIMRRMPTLKEKALNEIEGLVDIIGFYEYDGSRRVLHIHGRDDLVAGCRCIENFKTPAGKKVASIPMGTSEKEAVKNLQDAFDNKQKTIDGYTKDLMPAQEHKKIHVKKK